MFKAKKKKRERRKQNSDCILPGVQAKNSIISFLSSDLTSRQQVTLPLPLVCILSRLPLPLTTSTTTAFIDATIISHLDFTVILLIGPPDSALVPFSQWKSDHLTVLFQPSRFPSLLRVLSRVIAVAKNVSSLPASIHHRGLADLA